MEAEDYERIGAGAGENEDDGGSEPDEAESKMKNKNKTDEAASITMEQRGRQIHSILTYFVCYSLSLSLSLSHFDHLLRQRDRP